MDHFTYKNGTLCAENVPLSHIAEAVGTPFYCYSTATFERHFTVFADAVAHLNAVVCYAVKANSNVAVLRTLADLGAGADVVSGGELKRALAAGMLPERIVYSGVGKTRAELRAALKAGILQINVESEPELLVLDEVARELGVKAPIALRVNPDVDAKTHAKITTGKSENKFGIEIARAAAVYKKAQALAGIDVAGVAIHIGSQLTELDPFRAAFLRVRDLLAELARDGIALRHVDLGGGLGIPYEDVDTPGPVAYAKIVTEVFGDTDYKLLFEPGRMIAGNAGVLVSSIIYVKDGTARRFVIADAAMNDLIRPALYDAYHEAVPLVEPAKDVERVPVDIVGPICETGDTFGKDRAMPPLKAGDMIAFRSAGAYGAVMSNCYNSRALVPEVMVKDNAFSVVRTRVTIEEQIDHERLPEWMEGPITLPDFPGTSRK